ncbi:hypothetical protein [Lacipirellula sp.]|uniref:hypothetical protein n=1 Tax=Lacipirellula sp. TaxID=2691419 RepID=UPI003D1214AA
MLSDRLSRSLALMCALAPLACGVAAVSAQEPAQVTANVAPAPGEFAPGVLTTIPPSVDRADVISTHDIPEILSETSLQWEPASTTTKSRTLFEMAKDAVFINDVWCLEFAFKPLRMIEVDVPQPSGRVQRKQIWYMVYRVRNTGAGLTGKANPDGNFETVAKSTDEIRFIPELVLTSNDRSGGQRVRKAYLDRIVPTALGPIQQRELPRGTLYNSVDLAQQLLKVEAGRTQEGAWGVAMWEDVDPQIDFFSIYVRGLSNGLAWTDPKGAFKKGDAPGTGRKFTYKTLQLNFWRPGDDIGQNEREVRFGTAPQRADFYDSGEGVAYRWVYR